MRLYGIAPILVGLAALATSSSALAPPPASSPSPSPSPTPSSPVPELTAPLRLLYQNDLSSLTTNIVGPSYLLLRASYGTPAAGRAACAAYGERLADVALTAGRAPNSLQRQLDYALSVGEITTANRIRINGGFLRIPSPGSAEITRTAPRSTFALCTNSAPRNFANATDLSPQWSFYTTTRNGVKFKGYRDAFSFRFTALPYADRAPRFERSKVYSATGIVDGVAEGRDAQCPQTAGTPDKYREDCLVLNLWTNYIPTSPTNGQLRPVMLWIHGGGFNAGSGLDATFDGGELVSRGDVVVIAINYRLGSLGFLPIDDTHRGNYGVSDMITALRWVQKFGPAFGADPSRVTIFGQSAGAISISALLTSPMASGLFSAAIVQSGRPFDKANQRRVWSDALRADANTTITALGCNADKVTPLNSTTLACLRNVPTRDFLTKAPAFNRIVLDSQIITVPQVDVRRGNVANKVPLLMGFLRDEQAALGTVPPIGLDLDTALVRGGISQRNRTVVQTNPALFPVPPDASGTQNVSVTVQTDVDQISRCGQLATYFAASQSGAFPSMWVYTQEQRSYQIPNYDPYASCQPVGGNSDAYYRCHSGDLLPTFNTVRYLFARGARDDQDLPYFTAQMDQWLSFARRYNPTPGVSYLRTRGYDSSIPLTTGSRAWARLTSSNPSILSIGPAQFNKPLASVREAQCAAYGKGMRYILDDTPPGGGGVGTTGAADQTTNGAAQPGALSPDVASAQSASASAAQKTPGSALSPAQVVVPDV